MCLKGIKVGYLVHLYVLLAPVKVEVAAGQTSIDNLYHFVKKVAISTLHDFYYYPLFHLFVFIYDTFFI